MVVYEQVFPPKNDNLRRMSLSPRPVLLKRIDTLSVSASGKRRERRCIKRTSLGLSIFVTLHTSDPYIFQKWKPLCSCGEESSLFQKCKYSRKCHTLSIKIITARMHVLCRLEILPHYRLIYEACIKGPAWSISLLYYKYYRWLDSLCLDGKLPTQACYDELSFESGLVRLGLVTSKICVRWWKRRHDSWPHHHDGVLASNEWTNFRFDKITWGIIRHQHRLVHLPVLPTTLHFHNVIYTSQHPSFQNAPITDNALLFCQLFAKFYNGGLSGRSIASER